MSSSSASLQVIRPFPSESYRLKGWSSAPGDAPDSDVASGTGVAAASALNSIAKEEQDRRTVARNLRLACIHRQPVSPLHGDNPVYRPALNGVDLSGSHSATVFACRLVSMLVAVQQRSGSAGRVAKARRVSRYGAAHSSAVVRFAAGDNMFNVHFIGTGKGLAV